jgi:hypothetical protein
VQFTLVVNEDVTVAAGEAELERRADPTDDQE